MNKLEEQITNAKSEEELLQILADAGMPVAPAQLHAAMEAQNGELTEDALTSVSGGYIMLPWKIISSWYDRRRGGHGSGSGRHG